jgi:UrcA family protein
MMKTTLVLSIAALASVLAMVPAPSAAQGNPFDAIQHVRVPRPTAPMQSDAQARALLARLDKAAIEACGASTFSLPDVQSATRNGPCWHKAIAEAVVQASDPRRRHSYLGGISPLAFEAKVA